MNATTSIAAEARAFAALETGKLLRGMAVEIVSPIAGDMTVVDHE